VGCLQALPGTVGYTRGWGVVGLDGGSVSLGIKRGACEGNQNT